MDGGKSIADSRPEAPVESLQRARMRCRGGPIADRATRRRQDPTGLSVLCPNPPSWLRSRCNTARSEPMPCNALARPEGQGGADPSALLPCSRKRNGSHAALVAVTERTRREETEGLRGWRLRAGGWKAEQRRECSAFLLWLRPPVSGLQSYFSPRASSSGSISGPLP